MNLNIKFAIMIIVSASIGTILAFMWARLSLFVGTILKKRYANMRQVKSESLTSSYLDNASNHSGKQGQQRNQQIKTTNGVKTLYQRYYY